MRWTAIFLIVISVNVNGATWYVDGTSTNGTKTGTSWTNAWTNVSSIVMASLSAGDDVQIAAGTYGSFPNMNKSGTAGNPIKFRLAQDTNRLGHVYVGTTVNIYANYIDIDGSLNSSFTVPTRVDDLDIITNNIGMHISGIGTGMNLASAKASYCNIKWVDVVNCGSCTVLFPASGKLNDNGIAIGDPTTNTTFQCCWIRDNIYGDSFNSTDAHVNLRILDCLLENTGDDFIQINGGFEVGRCKFRHRTWGYSSGHTDVLQTWGSNVSFHNNIIKDFGESTLSGIDRFSDAVTLVGSAGQYTYGPVSFLWSTNGSTPAPFVTNFVLGTAVTNATAPAPRGFKFKVGSSSVSLTALGRIYKTGTTKKHGLALYRSSDNGRLAGPIGWDPASVGAVDGQILYTNLASPVTLSANTEYYVVSFEEKLASVRMPSGSIVGPDVFYDFDTAIQTENIATATNAVVGVADLYSSFSYFQTSYELNHDYFIYNNLFADDDTNRLCNPGFSFSHDAWWCSRDGTKYCTNNIISNLFVLNNLFRRPGGDVVGHTFYWMPPDTSRGTNELFTITNALFANNIIVDSYNKTAGMLGGTPVSFPVSTVLGIPLNGHDSGPIISGYYVSNNIIVGPNYQVGASNLYSNPLLADADWNQIGNMTTNLPSFRYFDSNEGPGIDYRLNASDTSARGAGLNLHSLTNLMPDLATDLDGVTRPESTAWDAGPYQYSDTGLILWLTFDQETWRTNSLLYDMSGLGNNPKQFGHGNGTNWPTVITSRDGSIGAFFDRWADATIPSTGEAGCYGAVTNLTSFTNLTNITCAAWVKWADSHTGSWVNENNQGILDAGYGYAGTFTWGKASEQDIDLNIWTNSVNTDSGSRLEVVSWGIQQDSTAGGTTNWHHYAWTFDGTNIIAYLDGAEVDSYSGPYGDMTNGFSLKGWLGIGCKTHYTVPNPAETPQFGDDSYPNHGWLHADLDDLRVYNRALTSNEVSQIYLGGGSGGAGTDEEPEPPSTNSVIHIGTITVNHLRGR